MAGILGKFFEDDQGAMPQSGILGGYGPMAGNQKAAMLFAGLRDIANNFSGESTNYAGQQGEDFHRQNVMGSRDAAIKKIQAAYAAGDMQAVRAAAIEHPEIGASILKVLEQDAPKYQTGPDGMYELPTAPGGTPRLVVPGQKKPAETRSYQKGMDTVTEELQPDGTWRQIGAGPKFSPKDDGGLGSDALFSMIDTPQGMYGVTRGGIPKAMTGPDGKPLVSYHSDPSLRYDLAAAQKGGAAAGVNAEAWPQTSANFQTVAEALKGFKDPAVRSQAGKSIGLGSVLPTVPGVNSDFRARQDQLKGNTFLMAYNSLRGGGAITEVEGKKAEDAYIRMSNAQTEGEFYRALDDFNGVLGRAHFAARTRAQRGQVVPQLGQRPAAAAPQNNDPLGLR